MDKRDKTIMLSILQANLQQEDRGTVYDGGKPVETTMTTSIIDENEVYMTVDTKGKKVYTTSLSNINVAVTIKN